MSFHSYLYIIPVVTLLCILCSDLPYSPYDPLYNGDYRFTTELPDDTLNAFVPYSIKYNSGKDLYCKFSVISDPAGKVDESYFNYKLTSDSLSLLFHNSFSGTVKITATRPNNISDTFSYRVVVINPFYIKPAGTYGVGDTCKFHIESSTRKALESVKKICWYTDSSQVDTLFPQDTFDLLRYTKGVLQIHARCYNWYNQPLEITPYILITNDDKPQLNVSIDNGSLIFSGDSLALSISIHSRKKDTGKFLVINGNDTASIDIDFYENDTLAFQKHLKVSTHTGINQLAFIYISNTGITSNIQQLFAAVKSRDQKQFIAGIFTEPEKLYLDEQLSITALTGFSPAGLRFNKFYWNTDDDPEWDITTTMPTCLIQCRGDSLCLALQCSDSAGFYTEIFRETFIIDSGIPVIDKVLPPEKTLCANTPFEIEIKAHDNPGGSIDTFKIVMTNDNGDSASFSSPTPVVTITANLKMCGSNSFSALAKDHSGHWSKPYFLNQKFTISNGFPVITRMSFADTAWYLQSAALHLDASDPNGNISKVIINWDDFYTDTIRVSTKFLSASYNHTYTRFPDRSLRKIRLSIVDNDNHTTTDSMNLTLHKGAPLVNVVSSKTTFVRNDTLYMPDKYFLDIVGQLYRSIDLHFSATDSNGQPNLFYCDIDSPYSITGAIDSCVRENFMSFDPPDQYPNHNTFSVDSVAVKTVLFCVDNDGLIGTDTFYIRTHQPPPIDFINQGDTLMSTTGTITWTGGVDDIDFLNTKITVKLRYPYDFLTFEAKDSLLYSGKIEDFLISSPPELKFGITPKVDFIKITGSVTAVQIETKIINLLDQEKRQDAIYYFR